MKRIYPVGLRLMCICLCLILGASTALPVFAVSSEESQSPLTYACKVYLAPNKAMIGRFEDGTKLNVLSERAGYYEVDCYDMTGFVPKEQVELVDGEYYVNCNPESTHSVPVHYVSLSEALELRAELLRSAQSKLGCRYVYATAGPNTFDCSGLTSYIFAQHGYSLHRSARDEMMDGMIVSAEGLQVGDLIFYNRTGRNGGSQVSHVGMYAGNGQIIHADSRGIRYTDMTDGYYAARYVCARRVICVQPAQAERLLTPSAGDAVMRGYQPEGLR